MNILMLHTFNLGKGWGGSASMLCALQRSFSTMGHVARVVSAKRPDPYGMTTCELAFDRPLTLGPGRRRGETVIDTLSSDELWAMSLAAAERIEREEFTAVRPDLMIANHVNLMALICLHLHRRWEIPYRIISYGTDTRSLLAERRLRDLFGPAAREADEILAISHFVAKELEATVSGRISVLGGAIDHTLFKPCPESERKKGRLIFVGRLVPEKGIMTLLDAMELQHAATELTIVGEGPLLSEIEARLAGRPSRCRVTLAGYKTQEQLRSLYASAKAMIVPSTWQEPLGLVVWEALACGIPVIATHVGGIPEMIADGKNGLLVPEGDAVALAGAIDRLLGDPAFYGSVLQAVANTKVPSYEELARRVLREQVAQ